jgi:ATP-dependent exoDNAse (exonuclease V) beta subunit
VTSGRTPGDDEVRQRLLGDLDSTFVVEAAAGTGKTTVLVKRIVALVKKGRARLEQLISVTFTEKAAGEMKLRLRTLLESTRDSTSDADERQRLTLALEELEVARIGTIHGLCADLLREYPVEARVDPLFEVAAEGDAEALQQRAFTRVFQDLLQAQPEGVRRALRRKQRGRDAQPPRIVLFRAAQQLIEHRDFATPWQREPFDRPAALDAAVEALRRYAEHAPHVRLKGRDSTFLEVLNRVRRFVADLDHREQVAARDHDGLEAQLRELGGSRFDWESKPWGLAFTGGRTEQLVAAARDEAWSALQDVVRRCDADLAALLHQELAPVVAAYELEKDRAGVLDFVDLLLLTRDLLQRNASVRESLQRRFTHLFIDEFQDTDPLQSEVVLLLASSDARVSAPYETVPVPGKLFVVGDPKQSVYRFRRADILLYHRVKAHLERHGARVEYLSTSFRSTPGIQAAVNGAFEPVMKGDHQARYVALGEWREPNKAQPSLIALPAPHPLNVKGKPTKEAIEQSVPDVVGGFVEWLVTKSGWHVDEDGQQVPVAPRHVCILFRRLRKYPNVDVPRPYAAALEARKVPHVLVGGRSFHHREEVMALRTALFAVDRPDDELSVYATLRGPFFALTDEVLFAFKQQVGRLQPLRPLDASTLGEPEFQAVAAALAVLKHLHFERNTRPVSATLHELLEVTRAHAGVAFWRAGAQALANVLQLGEVSRRYERRSTSFREVVEALQDEAEEGEAPDAPLVEQGLEGVRMMTVHAAKGLEFPVVILAEPTANAARQEPSHWVDPERGLWVHPLAGCVPTELRAHEHEAIARDNEESLRLSYVAATRAKDLLVVPVSSERRFKDTWTEVLYPSLYPPKERAHEPKPAPGCPAFGRDVIVDRVGAVPLEVPLPGLHRSETGKNGVVWFDPRVLTLNKEDASGLEADEALREDDVEGPRSIAEYEAWKLAHSDAVAKSTTPGMKVVVARQLEAPTISGVVPVEQTTAKRAGRPGGRRFGELVHAALATVPLDADAQAVTRTVEVLARSLLAPAGEVRAAIEAVEAALAHPRFDQARAAKQVRREATLVDHRPEDGVVVEGVIDLAFETDDGWVVVEFKTDEAIDESLARYEAQTQAYVAAIARATGKAVSGVILRV